MTDTDPLAAVIEQALRSCSWPADVAALHRSLSTAAAAAVREHLEAEETPPWKAWHQDAVELLADHEDRWAKVRQLCAETDEWANEELITDDGFVAQCVRTVVLTFRAFIPEEPQP